MKNEIMEELRKKGFSYQEIADHLDISKATVHNYLSGWFEEIDDQAGAFEEYSLQEISLEDVDQEESAFPSWREDYLRDWIYFYRQLKNLQNK